MACYWMHVVCCILILISSGMSITQEENCMEDSESCCSRQQGANLPTVTVSLAELPQSIAQCSQNRSTEVAVPFDAALNLTFSCTTTGGSVLWQLGGCKALFSSVSSNTLYQIFDRNKFTKNGIYISDITDELSYLSLHKNGRQFLSNQLQSNQLKVQCLAVVGSLSIFGADVYNVELYGRPCTPKDLVLYTNTSASGTLHWSRPHCMSELVKLSYDVTVTSIKKNNEVVFKATTNSTWITIDPTKIEYNMPLMFSVEAVNECTGRSVPAIINGSTHSIVKPVFGLKGGSVAAIVLCVGLFLLCSGIGGGCTCSFICCKNQYNNNK